MPILTIYLKESSEHKHILQIINEKTNNTYIIDAGASPAKAEAAQHATRREEDIASYN